MRDKEQIALELRLRCEIYQFLDCLIGHVILSVDAGVGLSTLGEHLAWKLFNKNPNLTQGKHMFPRTSSGCKGLQPNMD